MTNEVFFGIDASKRMKEGIDIGAKAVAVTLGANGRTVFIHKKGFQTEATKDGVTVITSIRLKDQLQDAGLKLIQEVSMKTAHTAGDGTTTSAVLMHEIVSRGLMLKQAGINPMEIKSGMEKALSCIVSEINSIKKDVGDDKKLLKQIATVSANNDKEIGDFIGGIYQKLGRNASILVQDANGGETSVELVNGFQFGDGYFSPYFINTKNNTAELINPYILIIDGKVENNSHIFPILEKVVSENRSVVIMADDFSHNILSDVLKNVQAKKLNAYFIKHGFTGETKEELLFDLCAITGATLITPKTGKKIENIGTSYLGQCEKIISKKEETTIFNGRNNKDQVALRVDDVTKKIKAAKNTMLKEKYELRLAKLSGGIAIYYVGGATNIEVGEKMARIDDAIRAVKCAIEDGVVVGGGAALIRCIDAVSKLKWQSEDEKSGIRLIEKSIEKPLFQIAVNSGKSGELIVERVKEKSGNIGYNAKADKIQDLVKAGIIDPAKVVIECVKNAVSAAAQFLISECAIVEENN